jgi:hypothetical protein
MMTRQARPSAKIIGFDTHMILEAVPARPSKHQNGHQVINQDITPLCRGPALTPCLQSDVFACSSHADLAGQLSVSSREIPQRTPVNGTR